MRLRATHPSIPWRIPRPITTRVAAMQVSAGQSIVECLAASSVCTQPLHAPPESVHTGSKGHEKAYMEASSNQD